jgi:hypothetical protein
MDLHTQAQVFVPQPPEAVFDRAQDASVVADALVAWGPIPGVVRVEQLGDGPGLGARRQVFLSDGAEMEEEITLFERPARYAYRWNTLPKPPFRWLVAGAAAEWSFAPSGDGTELTWRYRFTPTSIVAAPFAWLVVQIFQRWMANALRRFAAPRSS